MAKIIDLEKRLRETYEVDALEVIKESLGIALQHYTLEGEHIKAAKLIETLNAWDEFFQKGNDGKEETRSIN